MSKLSNSAVVPTGVLVTVFAVILIIMLMAGLNPRGYPSENEVSRPVDSHGLKFDRYGVAYTEPFVTHNDMDAIARDGLSIEIVLGLSESRDQTGTIAAVNNGNDNDQWYLWQWHQYIIVMNGDDYSSEQRLPRISVNSEKFPVDRSLLTITSNQDGSIIYLNGEVIRKKSNFIQAFPLGGQLLLGNTADGRRPWNGTISGLAFHKVALDPRAIRDRFARWSQTGQLPTSEANEPWILYPLDESEGTAALDRSGNNIHLTIPEKTTILKKIFLSRSLDLPLIKQLSTLDAGLNFVGFFPFGFVLACLLAANTIRRRPVLVLLVTTAGFALSIGIEFAQIWLPARSSTALDLILNTTGALVGALLYCVLLRNRNPD